LSLIDVCIVVDLLYEIQLEALSVFSWELYSQSPHAMAGRYSVLCDKSPLSYGIPVNLWGPKEVKYFLLKGVSLLFQCGEAMKT